MVITGFQFSFFSFCHFTNIIILGPLIDGALDRRGGDSLLRDPDGERGFLRRRGYNRPSGGEDEDKGVGVDYNENKGVVWVYKEAEEKENQHLLFIESTFKERLSI